MKVFVFSYNRGFYLRNCIDSIIRHVPDPDIVVVDDNSNDPEVYNVIDENRNRLSVYQPKERKNAYLGGLYDNISQIIDLNRETEKALFIQDDMQIVRDIYNSDIETMERFFKKYPKSINLNTNFMKRSRVKSGNESPLYDGEVPVYFRDGARRSHFSAVGVMNLHFINEIGFSFSGTEGENNDKASQIADPMGLAFSPFMMWLPFAQSTKFGGKTLFHGFAEWWVGAGFYPYRPMTPGEVESLMQRPSDQLPVAEDFLDPQGMDYREEWIFEDATKSIKFFHKIMKKKKKKMAKNRA